MAGQSGRGAHCSKSDPRLSTLTQDATASGPSVFKRSNRGQRESGRIGREVTPIVQQVPGDGAQAARDDGDGGVGLLAAGPVPPVEAAEVRRAADGHPGRLDKGPLQPAVGVGQHAAVGGLAAGAVGGGHEAGVAAELVGAGETRDAVDLGRHHRGEDGADAGQGLQALRGRIGGVVRRDLRLQRLDDGAELLEGGEVLPEQEAVGRGQRERLEPVEALLPELVAEDRPVEAALPGDDGVHAVAQHRAHTHQEQPLADDMLAGAVGGRRRVDGGHQIAAQERGEGAGVEPVGLDLRVGDQPGLERMRQHHVLDAVDLAEFVIEPAPVPAGLHHDAAGLGQTGEVRREGGGLVLIDAGLADASAGGVLRGHHGITLMVVDSGVEHSSRSLARMPSSGCLSCYLTPSGLPLQMIVADCRDIPKCKK